MGSSRSKINTQYNVVDLFCGVGGLTLGFENTKRFKTVFANDVDGDMCKSYNLNFPDTPISKESITNINFEEITKEKNIDVVIGGPPCQSYSTSGKRLLNDPRAILFKEYYRAIKSLKPSIFIYENVKGLLSMNKGNLIKEIKELFLSLNYNVEVHLLNAADYGVPQIRERIFVVGLINDSKFKLPKKTHHNSNKDDFFKSNYLTLEDALSDLPQIPVNSSALSYLKKPQTNYQKLMRLNSRKELSEQDSANHGKELLNAMMHLPEGGLKADIPEEYRPKSGYSNSYGRLWWKKPSTTITRNFGTPSSARCIHPKVDRALTTREGARLQSFPDWFQFYGSRAKKNLQIGNAVPPLLAEGIANSVVNYLDKYFNND